MDRIRRALLGRGVELRNEHVIHEAQDRYRLRTLSSGGKITLRFGKPNNSLLNNHENTCIYCRYFDER